MARVRAAWTHLRFGPTGRSRPGEITHGRRLGGAATAFYLLYLLRAADRIQARAVRRMGELYKSFNAQGQRTDKLIDGTVNKLSQKEGARKRGHFRQAATAVRVANVPPEKFEAAIEAPKPGNGHATCRDEKAMACAGRTRLAEPNSKSRRNEFNARRKRVAKPLRTRQAGAEINRISQNLIQRKYLIVLIIVGVRDFCQDGRPRSNAATSTVQEHINGQGQ
jgi:hypothetical protein